MGYHKEERIEKRGSLVTCVSILHDVEKMLQHNLNATSVAEADKIVDC